MHPDPTNCSSLCSKPQNSSYLQSEIPPPQSPINWHWVTLFSCSSTPWQYPIAYLDVRRTIVSRNNRKNILTWIHDRPRFRRTRVKSLTDRHCPVSKFDISLPHAPQRWQRTGKIASVPRRMHLQKSRSEGFGDMSHQRNIQRKRFGSCNWNDQYADQGHLVLASGKQRAVDQVKKEQYFSEETDSYKN